MMYYLEGSITEDGTEDINPRINAIDVKNRKEFFKKDYYDDFIEPEPFFNDMKMFISVLEDEEPTILNDSHGWAGEYPFKLWCFPISERLKDIFEVHQLVGSRFYPGTLNFQHKVYSYFVFHTLDNAWVNAIDLEKSVFTEWESGGHRMVDETQIHISSYDDFNSICKRIKKESKEKLGIRYTLAPKEIHLKEQFDLIYLPKLRYVISERLKQALKKANVSGLEYDPITNVDFYYQGEKI